MNSILSRDKEQSQSHPVLNPFDLAGNQLKNRAVVAPLSRVSTNGDGIPTKQILQYYDAFSRGGFGLIITEGAYTDMSYSQGYENQVGIASRAQIAAWRDITEVVHLSGAKIFAQLMHAGAISQGNHYRDETIAPSAIQPKGEMIEPYGGSGAFPIPREMNSSDIKEAVSGFAKAALSAKEAGFDGVEIHGGNGYLIDQFLTDYTNQRSDRYGGDISHRVKFAVEVLAAVKAAVGADYPVGIRLSQTKVNDFNYYWPGAEKDARIIFSSLAEAGVDYIHIASQGRNWMTTAQLGSELTITQLARQITQLPVIANGGMHDPSKAELILNEGHGDLISIGRGAIANPDWPQRLALGKPFEAFAPGMIKPLPTLLNTQQWLASHPA